MQAALGLVGLYLGACWVKPAWSKCSWQHKTVMGIVDVLLLGLLAWALFGGRSALALAVLLAVMAAVNLFQSNGRSAISYGDRKPPACSTTLEDEQK